jgi:hypothetical protein
VQRHDDRVERVAQGQTAVQLVEVGQVAQFNPVQDPDAQLLPPRLEIPNRPRVPGEVEDGLFAGDVGDILFIMLGQGKRQPDCY